MRYDQWFKQKENRRDVSSPRGTRLLHIFYDVTMSNGHSGLSELCKRKVSLDNMKPGDMIIFINSSWTAMKALTGSKNVLMHHKMESGHINPDTLIHLPEFVNGGKLDYQGANRVAITQRYNKWAKERGLSLYDLTGQIT